MNTEPNQPEANEPPEPQAATPGGRHVPFLELLKVREKEWSAGRAVFEMQIEDRHLRTLGILHGGVTAALLDTAMGMAAGTLSPEGHYVVTVQLSVNFIRPAWNGETLLANGDVIHAGKQTAVARGELRTEENVLVAAGTGTFMYVPHRDPDKSQLKKHADDDRA
jgi:uncharacterized protein (TIGR00369 family)